MPLGRSRATDASLRIYLFKSRLCLYGGTLNKQESIGLRENVQNFPPKNIVVMFLSKLVSLRYYGKHI